MTALGPITSRDDLIGRFEVMRRGGRAPVDFDREVRQLAVDSGKRFRYDLVLDLRDKWLAELPEGSRSLGRGD